MYKNRIESSDLPSFTDSSFSGSIKFIFLTIVPCNKQEFSVIPELVTKFHLKLLPGQLLLVPV